MRESNVRKAAFALAGVGLGLLARQLLAGSGTKKRPGRVALISGGWRGSGLALARRFAGKGARLAVFARDEAELRAIQEELPEAAAVICDASDATQVGETIAGIVRYFGQLDVVVNDAGGIAVGVGDFERAMDLIFWGTVNPAMAALPYLQGRRGACIVNLLSGGGEDEGLPNSCAYLAAARFSEGLKAKLRGGGVKVLIIKERAVETPAKTSPRALKIPTALLVDVLGLGAHVLLPKRDGTKRQPPWVKGITIAGKLAAGHYRQ